jgi:uncharacterized protein
MKGVLGKIKLAAEKELACSAHNMEHVMRVYNMAMKIAKAEKNVDMEVLQAATLLHDIARDREDRDKTGKICHARESAKMCVPILAGLGFSKDKIKKIQNCIVAHRFKTNRRPINIEEKILFDADKLDSLGAIVIVRAGMWMGRHNCSIFPKMSLAEYAKLNLVGGKLGGRIKDASLHNIFYEHEIKDKKLPGLMYTKAAKKIANERLKFTNDFLRRLKQEARGII